MTTDISPWEKVAGYLRGLAWIYGISPPSKGQNPTRTVARVFSALTIKMRGVGFERGQAILRLGVLSEYDITLEPWEKICVAAYKAAVAEGSDQWWEVETCRDQIKVLYDQLVDALAEQQGVRPAA